MLKILLLLPALGFGLSVSGQETVLLHEEKVENAYPRLSRDGKKILYQSNRTGKWQIFIMDTQSDKQFPLTNDNFNNNFPDWNTDGTQIAFVSDRDGNEEIYLINSDGTGLKRLTSDPQRDIHPYFSPDGRYVLFNSTWSNGSLDIFRYDLQTGKTVQLTNTPNDHETCARYSPDMKSIVFLRNNEETDDLFVLNLTNGLTENVSKTPYITDGWPVFSNDGNWIYYSSMEGQTYSIYRIRTDGTGKEQISFAAPGEEHARVFLADDGHSLIYNLRKGGTIDIRRLDLASK